MLFQSVQDKHILGPKTYLHSLEVSTAAIFASKRWRNYWNRNSWTLFFHQIYQIRIPFRLRFFQFQGFWCLCLYSIFWAKDNDENVRVPAPILLQYWIISRNLEFSMICESFPYSKVWQKILKPVKVKDIVIVNGCFSIILAVASCCTCRFEYSLPKTISLSLIASPDRHPFLLPLIPSITVVGKFLG